VAVGTQVTLQITILLVSCGTTFYLSELTVLTWSLGDGFSHQESVTGGVGSALYCGPPVSGASNSTGYDLEYAYSNAGTYSAHAQLNWTGGPPLLTNNVSVNATAPSPALAFAVNAWFYGVVGTVAGALLVGVYVRGKLPKPPSLPPGAT